jgi:hypothetical protein
LSETLLWGVPSFWIERFPLYYGKHLRIRYYWGGPELARAMAGGEVMIGEMGMPPFLRAYSEGLPAKVIGSSVIQQLDHYLVGRPEILGLESLKGRKVGILSPGSCDDYFARSMLRAAGVDPDRDVQLVPLGSAYGEVRCFDPQAPGHLPQVEAGFLVEPFVARGEQLGLVKVLASVRDYYPRYQWGIILATEKALADRVRQWLRTRRRRPPTEHKYSGCPRAYSDERSCAISSTGSSMPGWTARAWRTACGCRPRWAALNPASRWTVSAGSCSAAVGCEEGEILACLDSRYSCFFVRRARETIGVLCLLEDGPRQDELITGLYR